MRTIGFWMQTSPKYKPSKCHTLNNPSKTLTLQIWVLKKFKGCVVWPSILVLYSLIQSQSALVVKLDQFRNSKSPPVLSAARNTPLNNFFFTSLNRKHTFGMLWYFNVWLLGSSRNSRNTWEERRKGTQGNSQSRSTATNPQQVVSLITTNVYDDLSYLLKQASLRTLSVGLTALYFTFCRLFW